MSTDIIRRILRDYFKFNVTLQMNYTDVDDKIIRMSISWKFPPSSYRSRRRKTGLGGSNRLPSIRAVSVFGLYQRRKADSKTSIVRARQQHLLGLFKQKKLEAASDVTVTRLAALEAYLTKNLPRVSQKISPDKIESEVEKHYSAVLSGYPLDPGTLPGDREAKLKMHIKTARGASIAIGDLEQGKDVPEDNLADLDDVIMPWLDQNFGASVAEKSIFLELTKKFEERFEQDMENLNCLTPDIVTRVSDYAVQM